MLIQCLNNLINHESSVRTRSNAAQTVDWIVAIALLILGALGASGILPIFSALAYSFVGAGSLYTLSMILLSVKKNHLIGPSQKAFIPTQETSTTAVFE